MKKFKIKKLAKKALESKWDKHITLENYNKLMIGGCSFCKNAIDKADKLGDTVCNQCLLPKVFCYDGLYGENLIQVIHKCLHSNNKKNFKMGVNLVKHGLCELKRKGKLKEIMENNMKAFVLLNNKIVSEVLKKSKKIENNFLSEEFEL